MATVVCLQCGTTSVGRKKGGRFCSLRCVARSKQTANTCQWCGKTFSGESRREFCSNSCSTRSRTVAASKLNWAECSICGGDYVKRSGRLVCSDACSDARERHKLSGISEMVMGLYWAAVSTGRVKAAMHWRYVLVDYLRERDGDQCGICGAPCRFGLSTGPRGTDDLGATVDHIVPRSLGGGDELSNLRLAHWACNRNRGNRIF